jgi:hypothetical protein
VPWRFSAAGRLAAWIDRHPGSRKPAQERTHASQQKAPFFGQFAGAARFFKIAEVLAWEHARKSSAV